VWIFFDRSCPNEIIFENPQGVVEKVAVIFVDNSNQTTALEKFIFDFSLKQLIRSSLQPNEMEFALRGFLLKLSVCEPLLRPLPPGL
jgi:hypothetical protein